MKLGVRITISSASVLAIILTLVGVFQLRAVRGDLHREARDQVYQTASLIRSVVEAKGTRNLGSLRAVERAFARQLTGWGVTLFTGEPPRDRPAQWQANYKSLLSGHVPAFEQESDDTYTVLLPLRVEKTNAPSGYDVIGVAEVTRPLADIESAISKRTTSTIVTLVVILGAVILATTLLIATQVRRPLRKLIDGIDAVARGDLSRVVLQERDDEIGQLADRFNLMTQSLRESQMESKSENAAKLALEQRLRHSETMATVGQLAAEIAHEVGTPLNVISGRAKSIEKKTDNASIRRNATIVAEQSARITRIIERLLDLTRKRVGEGREAVDVDAILRSSIELLEGQTQNTGIAVTIDTQSNAHTHTINSDQLYQVVINLLVNAIQAMPNGGQLHVSTQRTSGKRPTLASADAVPCVCICVRDTGSGIPESERERIFEPFHTTKGESGTGLGLAVVSGIVRAAEGWIVIEDNKPKGTAFSLYLPIENEPQIDGSKQPRHNKLAND